VTPAQSSAVAIELRGVPGRSAESRARLLARRGPSLASFLALVGFGLVPFAVILIRSRGGVLTGATGIFPADQLQYLHRPAQAPGRRGAGPSKPTGRGARPGQWR